MEHNLSFGDWLRQRRRALDLTQEEAARRVGCATVTLKKIEQEERRPSKELAGRLAMVLDVPLAEQPAFIKVARANLAADRLEVSDVPLMAQASRAVTLVRSARAGGEEPPAPGVPPFKGMQAFDETDADRFFGRDGLIATLADRLCNGCFLAVVGASGSGKSSLVRAGLIPTLQRGSTLAHETPPLARSPTWLVHVITPTAHPLEALALSLMRDAESPSATANLINDLARDERILHIVACKLLAQATAAAIPGNGHPSAIRLLLIVDQFEELFTLCRSEAERTAFVDTLLFAVAPETDGPLTVVITLRADFYGHCAHYANLREVLTHRQIYIGPMSWEDLARAIEEPARRGGWTIEPGLVGTILRDVGEEPGGLPLLSHALLETWHRRQGSLLTLDGYAAAGGVQGGIARTAESVYQTLSAIEQEIARRIFLRLTELGEGTQDVRRRAAVSELISRSADGPVVEAVLQMLVGARLITMAEGTVEVAHEALIREWPTLREWLLQDREGLRLQRHLTETASQWELLDREPGELYRGARLVLAGEQAAAHPDELSALEWEFLEASEEHARREEAEREAQRQRERAAERRHAEEQARVVRQLRRRAIYLAGALGLALVAAGVAGIFARRAQASFVASERVRLAAQAHNALDRNESGDLPALLALQALRLGYTAEADAALMRALERGFTRQHFVGHTGPVRGGVAFSPDGQLVLTGSWDTTARLWGRESGQEVRQFSGHSDGVSSVAFSPDGLYVLTGSLDRTARLWETQSGQEVRRFTGHTDAVQSVAFSPDGQYILTGTTDTTARLWDAKSGQEVRRFTGHSAEVSSVAFSPDGRYVVTASRDRTARLWDVKSGQEVRRFTGHSARVSSVAFSPDGRYVVTASGNRDRTVRLWDVKSGQEVRRFTGHSAEVLSVAFSPDGRYVVTASGDGTARLWNAQTGQEGRQLVGHTNSVSAAVFSPDGKFVLTGSEDLTARLWDSERAPEPRRLIGHTAIVRDATFSPDGKYVLTSSDDASVQLWEARTGTRVRQFTGHTSGVNSVVFSPDGRYVLTSSFDQTARLWETESGQEAQQFAGHTKGLQGAAFSPDGLYVLTASEDATSRLWETQSGREVRQFTGHSGPVMSIAFSPDGKYVVTGSWDTTARVWDRESGQELRALIGHSKAVVGIAFSPDGRHIATSSWDATARLWDVETGKQVLSFAGHTDVIPTVAFSPDGKSVLTASWDNSIRLWDSGTGQVRRVFAGHTEDVEVATFSPEGDYVLTGADDATVRLYRLDYHDVIRFTCSLLTRDLTDDEREYYTIPGDDQSCAQT